MNIETQVLALFEEGNPVHDLDVLEPIDLDAAAYLATLQQRSSEVTQLDTKKRDQKSKTAIRARWLVAAAVGVLAAVAIGLIISAPVDQGPSIPVAGLANDPGAAEAFKVVEAAYGAYHAGDAEAWTRARCLDCEEVAVEDAAMIAAGGRYEELQCVSHGIGDWPDDGELATGFRFTCTAIRVDGFHGAGGIEMAVTTDWVVAGREVIAAGSQGDLETWFDFRHDQAAWLFENHPTVHESMSFDFPTDMPLAETMPTALEYVDEFVEASPDWPRQTGS